MDRFLRELEGQGFRARTVSISHLPELEDAIAVRRANGEFAEDFDRERLQDFLFAPPPSLPEARTIIIAAFPQPKIEVIFRHEGRITSLVIPPTYHQAPNAEAEELLKGILRPAGYRLARTSLPLKLLAVRSGLGRYGRNNICYVPGMGSYHRLMAFYTDNPAPEECWRPVELMESCAVCQACIENCPMGALVADRFLLRAERCLTYLNEKPGEFPAWARPSAHHALVGCLHCQDVCPENSSVRPRVERREEFTEEEGRWLLQGEALEKLPSAIRSRLQNLDLLEYLDLLPRNIRAAIAASWRVFCGAGEGR